MSLGLERPWVLVGVALFALGCGRSNASHVAVTGSECVVCHQSDYDGTTSPSHVEASFPTTCADCHSTSAWSPALGGQADTNDPARDLIVDAQIPRFSGTSIASLTLQAETLTNPMRHASTAVDPAARASCSNCHSGLGTLYPGTFHAALIGLGLPQPTTCNDCHAPSTLPTGFVGPLATTPVRTPPSGPMRHEAVLWASDAPTTTPIVTADCGSCHAPPSDASPTATWSGAVFHASLDRAAIAQPSSCLDCHANSRPDHPIDSTNSTLPLGRRFDHAIDGGLGDCVTCHSSTSTWSGGAFHRAGGVVPSSCTTCHDAERPTSDAGWTSTTYTTAPFDYGTNANGVTHGAGQDCGLCHSAPGTGGTDTWVGGRFQHAVTSGLDTSTCVACHASQRPDLVLGSAAAAAALLPGNFDHALNGSGDCFGCHQASVTSGRYAAYFGTTGTLPGGDWAGGTEYPGAFVSSTSVHITVTETTLHRTGTLVTSMTTGSTAYFNGMLHTSTQVPPEVAPGSSGTSPDYATCWHCHTSTGTMVTSYVDGQFHAALDRYTAMPGGATSMLAQPTRCNDCHAQMRPRGIVERGGSVLEPMDHAATFVRPVSIGGTMASGVADLDCSVCHAMPGASWADGAFHARIGTAEPADCTTCHYPAMADATHADPTSGTTFAMRHRSVQMTFQNCASCHTSALGRATSAPSWSLWNDGSYHAHTTATPSACVDCHTVSEPTVTTRSGSGQYMSHRASYVTGRDCVACHATDVTAMPRAWRNTTPFHATVATGVTTCQECHGRTNGLGGTNNDMPAAVTTTSFVTSASAATGVAGMHDQVDHGDVNVTGHDCNFCHTQTGPAMGPGGWTHGTVHAGFASGRVAMVINTTTGRCSHCHANLTPTPAFMLYDHTMIGTSDCSSCHSWPGTGTTLMANWLGAMGGAPATISVGGFTIPTPPAATPTTQSGLSGVPHPSTATACTTCHGASGGGRGAIGYDHAAGTTISSHCNTCHEAGSDLVSPVWNGTSGDTRPFTLASVRATFSGNSLTVSYPNHFYPVDCDECHNAPAGVVTGTMGTAFRTAWRFDHSCRSMTPVSTCLMCHTRTRCE